VERADAIEGDGGNDRIGHDEHHESFRNVPILSNNVNRDTFAA
jgi:hypothetical protein